MKTKIIVFLVLAFTMLVPNLASAYGGSHSFSSSRSSYSSSRSSFGSSSTRSSYSSGSISKKSGSSFFGSSSRKPNSNTSKPKVSLSKTTTNKSKSFSGSSSIRTTKSGSFSGRTSTVSGKVYKGNSTRTYYHGHYVSVNHYYNAGYSPSGWFGYYDGFTTGMFMSSMFHPWGSTYYVGGHYASYGGSPIAWIIDLILLLIFLSVITIFVIAAIRVFSPGKKIYTRRF